MAKGCEPAFISSIFSILRDEGMLYGEELCGAGGGGFMCLITSQPHCCEKVKATLQKAKVDISAMSFHSITVDVEGIHVSMEK